MHRYESIRQTLFVFGLAAAAALSFPESMAGQTKGDVIARLDDRYEHYASIAREMWENPELGYLEASSVALLQRELEEAGFIVETGVACVGPLRSSPLFENPLPELAALGR